MYKRQAEVTSLLGLEGYTPDPTVTPSKGTLRSKGSKTVKLQLNQGQCYALVAVGGEGVSDLDLNLQYSDSSVASDTDTQHAYPSVRHCPKQSADYKLIIKAKQGKGPYFYQLFSQRP